MCIYYCNEYYGGLLCWVYVCVNVCECEGGTCPKTLHHMSDETTGKAKGFYFLTNEDQRKHCNSHDDVNEIKVIQWNPFEQVTLIETPQ